jgi:hypothetical protein
MFIILIFVFEYIWLNPLILPLVLFYVLGHFIIILSIASCISFFMNIGPFDNMYRHDPLSLSDRKSMLIHTFICIGLYNLFL